MVPMLVEIQPWEIHVSFARRRLNTWSPPQRLNTSPHAELPATARPPKQRHGARHGRHGSNVLRSKQKLHWHEWSKDSKAPNESAKSWALICFWSASVWVFSMPWALHLSQVSQVWLEQVDLTALGVMPFHPFLNRSERQHCTKQIAPYCLRWIRDLCAVERVLGQPKGAGLIWWRQQRYQKASHQRALGIRKSTCQRNTCHEFGPFLAECYHIFQTQHEYIKAFNWLRLIATVSQVNEVIL